MDVADEMQEFKFIPLKVVAATIGCSIRTVENHCKRHRVPITRFSRSKRGLLPDDFGLLLARSRQPMKETTA